MAEIGRARDDDRSPANGSLLGRLLERVQALMGVRGDTSVRESLEDALEEHDPSETSLSKQERLMLLNILSFNELRVDDVMVPRADIIAVEEAEPLPEVVKTFCKAAHSRLPVYRDTLDDPVGMYHIKDVIQLLNPDGQAGPHDTVKDLAARRRPILFVPPSMPAIDLLIKMQTSRIHLALVIDEYGGTDGLVSIEDLVEEIVGDLEDKPLEAGAPLLLRHPDGAFDADARLEIEELEKELGIDLVPEERAEDLDTLGGLVVAQVGRVPQRGEIISHVSGLEFEVLDADPRRIKRLRVRGARKGGKGGERDGPGPAE
jgi:CBS domain containing-hemolysin-like protein